MATTVVDPRELWRRMMSRQQTQFDPIDYANRNILPPPPDFTGGDQDKMGDGPPSAPTGDGPPDQTYWGWVRDASNAGINYGEVKNAGWGGVLLRADDPNLALYTQKAREAGLQVGIWDVPRGRNPGEFADYLGGFKGYDMYMPDIEVEGKGYPGTSQWQYSEDFAKRFRELMPDARAGVTMEGMQDDYNYGAYTSRGFSIFPQAYTGSMNPYDAQAIRDWVARNGVDPNLIFPVLAPGQEYGGGIYSMYTLDDYVGKEMPSPKRAPASTKPDEDKPDFDMGKLLETISTKVRDTNKPGAVNYANKRLAQAVATGLIDAIPEGDPTQAWRDVSAGVAPAAEKAGMSPEDYLRTYQPPLPPLQNPYQGGKPIAY